MRGGGGEAGTVGGRIMRQTVTAAAVLLLDAQVPPAEWDAMVTAMVAADRDALARELVDAAILAARVARYFNTRALQQSHAQAVRDANTAVVQLAWHLGLAYPQRQRLDF